jgi:hypothetical protein
MRLKIPKISHDEAVLAFIKGLRHHDALRSKLLQKRPTTVSELLATAKNYADADDAEKIIKDDVGGSLRPELPPRHDDKRNDRGQNDRDQRNDNATSQTIVIGGMTTTTPSEASVLMRMIMKLTRLRSQVATGTIRRTMIRP